MAGRADLYNNIAQSIIKFAVDFVEAHPGCQFLDWDEHANIHELPESDLAGPAGIGMVDEGGGLYSIVFSIGVSTQNDPSLFRLRQMMSELYGLLSPGQQIALYDHEQNAPLSWMIVQSPVAVTPVTRTEVRPLQFIELQATVNPFAASTPAA